MFSIYFCLKVPFTTNPNECYNYVHYVTFLKPLYLSEAAFKQVW